METYLTQALAWGRARPTLQVHGLAGLALGLVVLLDWLSGLRLNLLPLYLVPVGWEIWRGGRRGALAAALAGGLAWWLVNRGGAPGLVGFCNRSSQLGLFGLTGYLGWLVRYHCDRAAARVQFDPLTGLLTRQAFYHLAAVELARAEQSGSQFVVVSLDADDFRQVNVEQGLCAGDELLQAAAGAVRALLRKGDLAARFGNDEFLLLLPATGLDEAEALLTNLRARLALEMVQRGWPVTFSAGFTTFLMQPPAVAELVERAQALRRDAKRSGKNGLKCGLYTGRERAYGQDV